MNNSEILFNCQIKTITLSHFYTPFLIIGEFVQEMLDLFFIDQFGLAELLCEQFGTDVVADYVSLVAGQLFKVFSRPHDYF
jgi:hypothetical protein